jgi:AcrR family transcriptional regulator
MVNQLKQENIRGIFIQAAKNTLKSEGIKALSAREIGKATGFSYATIYNYFKDMNELCEVCMLEFLEECKEHVLTSAKSRSIKDMLKAYAMFYVQYPGLYALIFTDGNYVGRFYKQFSEKTEEMYNAVFDASEVETKNPKLPILAFNAINGLLLAYINRNTPSDFAEFMQMLDAQIELLSI